ncbi:hypothetical protein AOLI_G00261610 [Acnodon oligacanthus]
MIYSTKTSGLQPFSTSTTSQLPQAHNQNMNMNHKHGVLHQEMLSQSFPSLGRQRKSGNQRIGDFFASFFSDFAQNRAGEPQSAAERVEHFTVTRFSCIDRDRAVGLQRRRDTRSARSCFYVVPPAVINLDKAAQKRHAGGLKPEKNGELGELSEPSGPRGVKHQRSRPGEQRGPKRMNDAFFSVKLRLDPRLDPGPVALTVRWSCFNERSSRTLTGPPAEEQPWRAASWKPDVLLAPPMRRAEYCSLLS